MPLYPRIFDNAQALGAALARRIVEGISSAHDENRPYLLGCPGGRSLASTYQALPLEAQRTSTDLSPLRIVMMDDYVTPVDDRFVPVPSAVHFSCRRFATEEIVAPLRGLPGAPGQNRIWMPDPAHPARFDPLITEAGGIDLFLLASGAGDGHIGFNPPGSHRGSTTRIVELAQQTRIDNMVTFPDFKALDEVPTHGVTVGIGTIADHSRSAVMVCLGSDKRHAVRRITDASSYDPSWPATILADMPNAELWIDQAAHAWDRGYSPS